MRQRLMFVLLMVVMLLGGCSQAPISSEAASSIRRVAIVTLIPEEINVSRIGFTVFNNKQVSLNLGGELGNTADLVTRQRLFVSRKGWTVVPITYDRKSLLDGVQRKTLVMSLSVERVRSELAELAQKNNLDALVVFTSASYDRPAGQGLGVWMRTFTSNVSDATVHANISVVIVRSDGSFAGSAHGQEARSMKASELGLNYELDFVAPGFDGRERVKQEVLKTLESAINKRIDEMQL